MSELRDPRPEHDGRRHDRRCPAPFVSFAQNHEDVVLARALRPDRGEGFWIDVGAGDPVFDSTTAAFSERGWRGINVEPLVREHELLSSVRPRDVNLCVALGATPGIAKLYEGPDTNRGSSTMLPELAAGYIDEGEMFTPREVTVSTLAHVVANHAPDTVDLLKVDVEGMEAEVLAGADWSRFRPRVIVVEATVPNSGEPSHEAWEPMLLDLGYELALFDGLNRFYGCADDADVLSTLSVPANVLDHFVPHVWTTELQKAQRWAHSLEKELNAVRAANTESMRQLEEQRESAEVEVARAAEENIRLARDGRYARDLADIAEENAAVAREELAASELLTVLALAETKRLRADVGAGEQVVDEDARDALAEAQAELEALRATRTFQYTKGLRAGYGRIRRILRVGR